MGAPITDPYRNGGVSLIPTIKWTRSLSIIYGCAEFREMISFLRCVVDILAIFVSTDWTAKAVPF